MASEFLQQFIDDSFLTFNPDITNITFSDVIIGMFWALTLSIIIATTYRITHRGVSYSQSYTQTLILLAIVVSSIMLIVGTDIARAFTLVGALSIVRFRNAIKDTRDVGFIFFTMAVGMACGTRFYPMAITLTVVGCVTMYIMTISEFGQKGVLQDIVEFNYPLNRDYKRDISSIFKSSMNSYSILSIDSVGKEMNRYSFIVTFKNEQKRARLMEELKEISFVNNAKIISGQNTVEI